MPNSGLPRAVALVLCQCFAQRFVVALAELELQRTCFPYQGRTRGQALACLEISRDVRGCRRS